MRLQLAIRKTTLLTTLAVPKLNHIIMTCPKGNLHYLDVKNSVKNTLGGALDFCAHRECKKN